MGLYKASNLSSELPRSRKNKAASVADPNSPKNVAKSGRQTSDEMPEKGTPRKRLVDMTLSEQVDAAKDRMLDMLSRSPQTSFELTDKLSKKGFKLQAIEKAVNRLTEVGLINDAKFAQEWAYSRFHYSGRSTYAIAQELKRKGLPDSLIENALEDYQSEELQHAKALELAEAKASSLSRAKGTLESSDAKKIAAMLARRGFAPGLCFEVAKEVVRQHADVESQENTP